MIHISKSGGKFHVTDIAGNNSTVVKTSQSAGLDSFQGAIKNVRASMRIYGTPPDKGVYVQDDTVIPSRILWIRTTGKMELVTAKKCHARYRLATKKKK